jgi:hypothetical protein
MRYVVAFGRFWWDFIVGEDWRVAASVAVVLLVAGVAVSAELASDGVLTVATGTALALLAMASIVGPARRARRR